MFSVKLPIGDTGPRIFWEKKKDGRVDWVKKLAADLLARRRCRAEGYCAEGRYLARYRVKAQPSTWSLPWETPLPCGRSLSGKSTHCWKSLGRCRTGGRGFSWATFVARKFLTLWERLLDRWYTGRRFLQLSSTLMISWYQRDDGTTAVARMMIGSLSEDDGNAVKKSVTWN